MNDKIDASEQIPLSNFEAVAYKPEGGYRIGSLFQLVGALGAIGIITGGIAHFIGQFFWLIILFPLGIGVVVGLAGSYLVDTFRVRSPLFCSLAGLAAGIFSMLAMHYMDFRDFESTLRESMGAGGEVVLDVARNIDQLKAKGDQTPLEIRNLITELEADPESLKVFQIDTFPEFIDMAATQGVKIGKAGRGGNETNLGYVGSYIYWGVEIFLVAGIALALMRMQAKEPFCTLCDNWKVGLELGPYTPADEVLREMTQGSECNLALEKAIKKKPEAQYLVKLHSCPQCVEDSPVDAFVKRLDIDKEGNVNQVDIGKLTYPEQTFKLLCDLCVRSAKQEKTAADFFPASPSEEEPDAERDAEEEAT